VKLRRKYDSQKRPPVSAQRGPKKPKNLLR